MMSFLAGIVAFAIVGLELLTGRYPRTWFLVVKSKSFWAYCAIYGTIAFFVFLGVDHLVAAKKIQFSDGILAADWLRALGIGIAVKSLLHINLINVRVGPQAIPIGLESFVLLFEPHLLRNVLFDEFNNVRSYIQPKTSKYSDLRTVRRIILQNVPSSLPAPEVANFNGELSKAKTPIEALEQGLRFLGKSTFERIFP